MVERADMLVRLQIIIENWKDVHDSEELYWNICRLYEGLKDGMI
jgi:hypothetical protein